MFIGEIYNNRYEVLKKLGWGHFSTVWLCKDLSNGEKVAMKVQKSAKHYTIAAKDEIAILERVAQEIEAEELEYEIHDRRQLLLHQIETSLIQAAELAIMNNMSEQQRLTEKLHQDLALARRKVDETPDDKLPPLPEYEKTSYNPHVVRLIDHFEHTGPHGVHVCMVFPLLGDNLLTLIQAYNYKGIPSYIVRKITRHICKGLDFLHNRCKIIHTDLKPENILLSGKLPPLPLHPDMLEGSAEIEVDMTPEELKAAAAQEAREARMLGLTIQGLRAQKAGVELPSGVVLNDEHEQEKKRERRKKPKAVSLERDPALGIDELPEFKAAVKGLKGGARKKVRKEFIELLKKRREQTVHDTCTKNVFQNHLSAMLVTSNFTEKQELPELGTQKSLKKKKSEQQVKASSQRAEEPTKDAASPTPISAAVLEPPLPPSTIRIFNAQNQSFFVPARSTAVVTDAPPSAASSATSMNPKAKISEKHSIRLIATHHKSNSDITDVTNATGKNSRSLRDKLEPHATCVFAASKQYVLDQIRSISAAQEAFLVEPVKLENISEWEFEVVDSSTAVVSPANKPRKGGKGNKKKNTQRKFVPTYSLLNFQLSPMESVPYAVGSNLYVPNKEAESDSMENPPSNAPAEKKPVAQREEENDADVEDIEPLSKELSEAREKRRKSRGVVVEDTNESNLPPALTHATAGSLYRAMESKFAESATALNQKSMHPLPDFDISEEDEAQHSLFTVKFPISQLVTIVEVLESLFPQVAFLNIPIQLQGSTPSSAIQEKFPELPDLLLPSSQERSDQILEALSHHTVHTDCPSDPSVDGSALVARFSFIGVQISGDNVPAGLTSTLKVAVESAIQSHDTTVPLLYPSRATTSNALTAPSSFFREKSVVEDECSSPKRTNWNVILQTASHRILPWNDLTRVRTSRQSSIPSILDNARAPLSTQSRGKSTLTLAGHTYFVSSVRDNARILFDAHLAAETKRKEVSTKVKELEEKPQVPYFPMVTKKKVRVPKKLTPEEEKKAFERCAQEWLEWENEVMRMSAYIVDLGNACWTNHHFTEEIQTRQYRAPEVILRAGYDASTDVWSLAAVVFECLTGDLLFDPAPGENFDRCEDHLAQMIELLGPIPRHVALRGKLSSQFFDRDGNLRRIHNLNYWGLTSIFIEKYSMNPMEASIIDNFLTPMLAFDPKHRIEPIRCLEHPWIHYAPEGFEEIMTSNMFIDFTHQNTERVNQAIIAIREMYMRYDEEEFDSHDEFEGLDYEEESNLNSPTNRNFVENLHSQEYRDKVADGSYPDYPEQFALQYQDLLDSIASVYFEQHIQNGLPESDLMASVEAFKSVAPEDLFEMVREQTIDMATMPPQVHALFKQVQQMWQETELLAEATVPKPIAVPRAQLPAHQPPTKQVNPPQKQDWENPDSKWRYAVPPPPIPVESETERRKREIEELKLSVNALSFDTVLKKKSNA